MAIMFAFAVNTHAQTRSEANIKVLPSKAGILKVHYALPVSEPITVKFFNANGLITSDKIRGEYSNGLMKKYDIKNINGEDYRVEISSAKMEVTYHVVPSKDKQSFEAYLEKATYNYPVVASNN